ncbi:MAG: cobalamin-dependent protein [Pseudomonadota bacterium]
MASRPPSSVLNSPNGVAFASVALKALKTIAQQRRDKQAKPLETSPEVLSKFAKLIFARDYVGGDGVTETMNEADVQPEQVLDYLIPKIAEKIGHDWMNDDMSFAHVTVVSARLQNLAWLYIEPFRDAADQIAEAPRVLVAVPEGETHALGGVLSVGAFARLGCQAITAIGASNDAIVEKSRTPGVALIAISTAASADMPSLRDLTRRLKARKNCPPISVGGSIVGTDKALAETLNVDLITTDVTEALALTIGRKLFKEADEQEPARDEGQGGTTTKTDG